MQTVYELDDEDKRNYGEFIQCVQRGKRSYRIYPIAAGLAAGLLYSPKGDLARVSVRRLGAAFIGYALCSAVTSYICLNDCKHHFQDFMEKLENKKKMGATDDVQHGFHSQTPPATEDISYSSDLNLPSNTFSYGTSSFQENIYEEKDELTLSKKPVTYKDLWDSHHNSVQSRLNEENSNTGRPAGTPPTKPVARNIYGDPLE